MTNTETTEKFVDIQKAQISKIEDNTKEAGFSTNLTIFSALRANIKQGVDLHTDSKI